MATGEVCIANISPRERSRRLKAGAIQFALGLVILGALMAFGASRGWRILVLPFFAGASFGFFQWRDKT